MLHKPGSQMPGSKRSKPTSSDLLCGSFDSPGFSVGFSARIVSLSEIVLNRE